MESEQGLEAILKIDQSDVIQDRNKFKPSKSARTHEIVNEIRTLKLWD